MSIRIPISIIVTIAAIVLIYWLFDLARQPGGSLMYLTIFSIAMAYFSFTQPSSIHTKALNILS